MKGATISCAPLDSTWEGFNPRAHEGRDVLWALSLLELLLCFNPRAHEGRDYSVTGGYSVGTRFNPRAHEGRDHNRPLSIRC